jgi:hypothetical protein
MNVEEAMTLVVFFSFVRVAPCTRPARGVRWSLLREMNAKHGSLCKNNSLWEQV